MIPVVDIFAGPGGLGEGFTSYRGSVRDPRFKLVLSIEKDPIAHSTLRLRAFRRGFAKVPSIYTAYLRGEADWNAVESELPEAARAAADEARCLELGPSTDASVRELIRGRVAQDDRWVLIGGPPCQAYSLVGRARNRGVASYRPELDHRQTLYIEYLQILADHAPPVFVMENVKGLLSAQLNSQRLFDRIREDLSNPAEALRREDRRPGKRRPRYAILALVPRTASSAESPESYVVRAEDYGVPQRRHRVILIGVRSDIDSNLLLPLHRSSTLCTVQSRLSGLPPVRSGLSKQKDSGGAWLATLKGFRQASWLKALSRDVRVEVIRAIERSSEPAANRGAEYLADGNGEVFLNHSSRAHIASDLARYLFVSSFGKANGSSPKLGDFPSSLLPNHENVDRALEGGMFSDRFRVQLADQPATTITSHISKDGHYYVHPDPTQCRSLTVREAARLQTFPEDYFFCGPRTAQYLQVGNAVPPSLATQIASRVAQLLR